jgi:hypothetical protein
MRRRDFIRIVGSAAAWPLGAHAQQPEGIRRIGVLMNFAENDPAAQARLTAFLQAPQQLGWTNGRNVRIDIRWSAGDPETQSQIRGGASRTHARRHPCIDHRERGCLTSGDASLAYRFRAGR